MNIYPEFELPEEIIAKYRDFSTPQIVAKIEDSQSNHKLADEILLYLGIRISENPKDISYLEAYLRAENLSFAVVTALCSILKDEAIPALIRLLDYNGEYAVNHRRAAVRALGRIRNSDAIPYLTWLLTREEWTDVNAEIVSSLIIFGNQAVPELEKVFGYRHQQSNRQSQMIAYARQALETITGQDYSKFSVNK